jgi:hypothetical protein
MPNLTLLSPFQELSITEVSKGNFTHKCKITLADLNAVPSATTASVVFNLPNLGAGNVVADCAVYVQTAFTFSNASILVNTVAIGDGSSATTYLTAKNIGGTGMTTPVAVGACYVTSTPVAYPVSTNGQLIATVAVTAAQAFNTATAGEINILFDIRNLADLAYPQQ